MAIDTTYQMTKSELDELTRTGKSTSYDKRIAAYNASKKTSAAASTNVSQQVNQTKAALADLQAQAAALKKYGVDDTKYITKNSAGNYVLNSAGKKYVAQQGAKTTDEAVANAQTVAANGSTATMAYKDSAAYKALSAEAKDFIDLAYESINVGGEDQARQLSSAIENAVNIADPYYAAQLKLAQGEIAAAIAEQKGDYESKYRIIEETQKRLAQDVAAESQYLTLEQQADLATVVRGFKEDLLSIADEAAEKGLTFATGARSKALADERRTQQMEDVVQSSKREYNYKINELKTKAARGDEDAAAELADLQRSNDLSLQKIGRTAETVLGSTNVPAITGYTPVGGVLGSVEEEKRKAILSDVGSIMDISSGFNYKE